MGNRQGVGRIEKSHSKSQHLVVPRKEVFEDSGEVGCGVGVFWDMALEFGMTGEMGCDIQSLANLSFRIWRNKE